MVRRFLAVLVMLVVIGGCAGAGTPGEVVGKDISSALKYLHDDQRHVGCWFIVQSSSTSIACLADKDYMP
jgi:hypothetical protein